MTEMTTTQDSTRAEFTAALRARAEALTALAGRLDAHPEAKLPYQLPADEINIYCTSTADQRAVMAATARAIGCTWTKKPWEANGTAYFDLVGDFHGITIAITAYRDQVCERVVTGTEEREVDEVVTPAVTKKVMKTVEVVEWDCGSLLAPRLAAALDA